LGRTGSVRPFTQDRFGYERNYGVLDQKWHRFAARYNFWDRSHIDGSQCAVDFWRDAKGNIQKYAVDGNGDFTRDANGLPVPAANGQPYPGGTIGLDVHASADGKTEDLCAFGTHEAPPATSSPTSARSRSASGRSARSPCYGGDAPADSSRRRRSRPARGTSRESARRSRHARGCAPVGDADMASARLRARQDVTKRLMMNDTGDLSEA
jgi:hypothetical protein